MQSSGMQCTTCNILILNTCKSTSASNSQGMPLHQRNNTINILSYLSAEDSRKEAVSGMQPIKFPMLTPVIAFPFMFLLWSKQTQKTYSSLDQYQWGWIEGVD